MEGEHLKPLHELNIARAKHSVLRHFVSCNLHKRHKIAAPFPSGTLAGWQYFTTDGTTSTTRERTQVTQPVATNMEIQIYLYQEICCTIYLNTPANKQYTKRNCNIICMCTSLFQTLFEIVTLFLCPWSRT